MQSTIIYEENEIIYETDLYALLMGVLKREMGVPKDYFFQSLRDAPEAHVKILASSGPEGIFHGIDETGNRHGDPNRYKLQDLSMIEAYPNIRSLEVGSKIEIASLDGVSSLVNLEVLNIGANCRLSNLHGLEFCSLLRSLAIPANDVSDLSPVQDNPLSFLDISFNPISSLAGMNLANLKRLTIDQSQCHLFEDLQMPALMTMIIAGVTDEALFDKMTARYGEIVERR